MAPRSTITVTTPLISTYHKKPYSAISPRRPGLSQKGKTVVVAGGSGGIGFSIAHAFVQAEASHVILLGRRDVVAQEAASDLSKEVIDGSDTKISAVSCDVTSLEDTEKLWNQFKDEGIFVDVLVMNAAVVGDTGPILESSLENVWTAFEANVRSLLDFARRLHGQDGDRPRCFINLTTTGIHNHWSETAVFPTYGLTKNSGTLLMQKIAQDTDPRKMQILSIHPGGIWTKMSKSHGVPDDSYDWDHEDLPGCFAVWAASEEARFLHGRWVAAHWDVDELKGRVAKELENDKTFGRIGVLGISGDK
ncbi:NAD(P)-binding protein [Podospora aff. communis PSN243]|uniref:NAD(P)-binding protein n=1 Tax=Podospora aff. communis PSN243 TaxID=3040156 RepID=A0AAV9GZG4_9PEZI|nr:NAD(P)-binding protein [Podospora aff. communis PSN243]